MAEKRHIMLLAVDCPRCGPSLIKKNGQTHYGKPHFKGHSCSRQFVENGQAGLVSEPEKELVNKLLLERISLAGICRAVGVSASWLLGYLQELYAQLSANLNAAEELPDLEAYLANRMEEEISRLRRIKKIQQHWKDRRKQVFSRAYARATLRNGRLLGATDSR